MAQFKVFSPEVQVIGTAVLSVVKGMGAFQPMALKILARQGIADIQQDEWYGQQDWLNAFQEISESMGGPVLRVIGHKIPETAIWPPEVSTIEQALVSIDVAYHMNHRNGNIGHYTFIKTGERSGKMTCGNPYPCDFDFGIIEGTGKKFAPDKTFLRVQHDNSQPCRKADEDSCTYLITW